MNALVLTFNHAAEWVTLSLLRAAGLGGAAVLLIWLLNRMPWRIPASIRCWLWRLAYLKFLVAFCWAAPILLPLLPAPTPVVQPLSNRPNSVLPAPIPALPTAGSALIDSANPLHALVHPPQGTVARPTLATWLTLAWGLGVLWNLAGLGRQWWATRRLAAAAQPLDGDELQQQTRFLAGQLRLRHPPALGQHAFSSPPMLLGVLRPMILLPCSLTASRPIPNLRLILAHELAHLKRRDLLWNWLPSVVHCLLFFHPLLWLARREWQAAQEMACDEIALHLTRTDPADYASLLLDVATLDARSPLPGRLLAAGVVASTHTLKKRLIAMKTIHPHSPQRAVLAATAVMLLAGLLLIPWRLVAQEPKPPPAPPPPTEVTPPSAPRKPQPPAALPPGQNSVIRPRTTPRPEEDMTRNTLAFDQRLVDFNENVARAELEAAQAELNAAKVQLDGLAAAYKDNVVSPSEFETQRAQVARAEANYLRAKTRLDYAHIWSEMDEFQNAQAQKQAAQFQLQIEQLRGELDQARHENERLRQLKSNLPDRPSDLTPSPTRAEPSRARDERLNELFKQEIQLAEKQLEFTQQAFETGRATADDVLRVQRDLLSLKRQQNESMGDPARVRDLLKQEITLAQRRLGEITKRIETGIMPPGSELEFRRYILSLQRQLTELDLPKSRRSGAAPAPPPPPIQEKRSGLF